MQDGENFGGGDLQVMMHHLLHFIIGPILRIEVVKKGCNLIRVFEPHVREGQEGSSCRSDLPGD